MDKKYPTGLMWFRRDLRAHDNAALYHALRSCSQLHCVFILDTDILDDLPRADRRVEFILAALQELDTALRRLAGQPHAGLIVRIGSARDAIPATAQALHAQAVFANHDDEPFALARDARVRGDLAGMGIALVTSKDHVIFERSEVLTQMGRPYSVFTPYKSAWLKKLEPFYLSSYPVDRHAQALAPRPEGDRKAVPGLADIGFEATNLRELKIPLGASGGLELFEEFFERMDHYHVARDYPAVKGPSYLGVHLRFGTVSIRQLAGTAQQLSLQGMQGASVWLSELCWRDFYMQILAHFPHVASSAFKPEYDAIKWEHGKHAETLFAAWCHGQTGYPLVDAAMAQINQSGYMHNRLRMVVASFLTKDLGIDWRWGERYFAEKLNDFELASNNGGWQWAASTGCDAQPYFRIFNPVSQSERFDADGKFIRRYLPQLASLPDKLIHAPWRASEIELEAAGVKLGHDYPRPLVDHADARERTLARYAVVKKPLDAKPKRR
ncbi:deoxyribodipyrimidine photo-lyase [Pseudorhodoferax sp. Leaf267]|uniref:cryptochrome/photolyase family protein n=1 Tax=Pseudorhodoferax sp. Leaf267 TaxID=1736316 RepID=UPI0006F5AE6A|nr:deoxyribodipyrimidine photo-lyase [Pseudorhodoferax sp. Leaf267]KQP20636.1 deoxyribodipyrimidine photolyase [Pseudorhodoferax sp. Leaf267]